jgi:DDB1- and CUL4-associated factor 11
LFTVTCILHLNDPLLTQTVRGEIGRWTITDATLSHDNRFLAYSSITPCVYFARTGSSSLEATNHESWKDGLGPDETQTVLDFSGYNPGESRFPLRLDEWEDRMDSRTGIWSLRFSADGRELVAGASDQCLYGMVSGPLSLLCLFRFGYLFGDQ